MNLGWKLAQVVNRTSPESLLDTYHAERHPVAARVLRNTMAQVALRRPDERIEGPARHRCPSSSSMDEPRKRFAAMMSGLDIHYDLGEGHPLLGRRMPDLDLVTADGPLRVFTLLHDARPVLLNLGEPGGFDITPWADRVQLIDAEYVGAWELPVLGAVTAPTAVLIRPDGYVAWVGDRTQLGAPRRADHLVRTAYCGVAHRLLDLTNASAIVTGGAGGFGAATVRRLAQMGAKVVIADVSDERSRSRCSSSSKFRSQRSDAARD